MSTVRFEGELQGNKLANVGDNSYMRPESSLESKTPETLCFLMLIP